MQQTVGREKAKRNIILFIIGVFIAFVTDILSTVGSLTGNVILTYIGMAALAGLVLQIIAIVCLRNVNSHYANAMWCLIIDLLLTIINIVLIIIIALGKGNDAIVSVSNWVDVASDIAEASIVIFFVLGTNQLAEENDKGMPLLTKIIVIGYMVMFFISLVFSLLTHFTGLGENETVVGVFTIVIFVLYVIREIAYIIFLIRALFRVK